MSKTTLSEVMNRLKNHLAGQCIACGECVSGCPVDKSGFMPDGPEVAMERLIEAVSDGKISKEAYDLALSCTHCRQCRDRCPQGLHPDLLMIVAMAELIRCGMPVPTYLETYSPGPYGVTQLLSAMQSDAGKDRWLKSVPSDPPRKDMVVYLGCLGNAVPHQLYSIIDVIDSMAVDYVALGGGELCCGVPQLAIGDYYGAEEKGKALIDGVMAFQPQQVIFSCIACYNNVTQIIPQSTDVPFQSQYIAHYLADRIDRIPFSQSINKTATLHDSCELGRGMQEFDVVRRIIQAVPGLRFVEMEHNRENTLCCGYQGALFLDKDSAQKLRRKRVQEAADVRADILVTPCRGCLLNLSVAGREQGIEVMDYVHLLATALGSDHFNCFPDLVEQRKNLRFSKDQTERLKGLDMKEVQKVLEDYLDILSM